MVMAVSWLLASGCLCYLSAENVRVGQPPEEGEEWGAEGELVSTRDALACFLRHPSDGSKGSGSMEMGCGGVGGFKQQQALFRDVGCVESVLDIRL